MTLTKEEAKRAYILLKALQNKELTRSTKEYLKPVEHKVWHDVVQEQMVKVTLEFDKFFKEQADILYKLINEKEQLFIPKKKSISKAMEAIELIIKSDSPKKYKVWEYLDKLYNRVVVDDINDTIVEYFDSFNKKIEGIYKELLHTTYDRVSQSVSTEETPFEFNKTNKWVKDKINDKVIKWSKQVTKTTEDRIKRQLVKGYDIGASIFDIANSIKTNEVFSFSRAERIARTEIFSSANYIDYLTFNDNQDVVGYKWVSMEDKRVRPTHTRANGQFRKKGEPFNIGGSKLLHPGDNSLGAAAKEIICCRCYLEPVFADEIGLGSGKGNKDSNLPNEVKSLGHLNIEDEEGIEQFIKLCEDSIKEQPIEYAFVITAEGEALQVKGTTGQVHIEKVGADKLKGAIVTHNHPNIYQGDKLVELGGSFSEDDLFMFVSYGLSNLRAIDGRYRYKLQINKITLNEIDRLYTKARIEIMKSDRYLTDTQIKHEILALMSNKNQNIIYTRSK